MVARNGYQRGCLAVAEHTSIRLLTINDLESSLESEMTRQRLLRVLVDVTQLIDRLSGMAKRGERPASGGLRRGIRLRLPSGPGADEYLQRLGELSSLKEQVVQALGGGTDHVVPIRQDSESDEPPFEAMSSATEFCTLAEQVLKSAKSWLENLVPAD